MNHPIQDLSRRYLRKEWEHVTQAEREILEAFRKQQPIARDAVAEYEDNRALGERLADRIAAFGGS